MSKRKPKVTIRQIGIEAELRDKLSEIAQRNGLILYRLVTRILREWVEREEAES